MYKSTLCSFLLLASVGVGRANADGPTSVSWSMNEITCCTMYADGGAGPDGSIGSSVVVGLPSDASFGYGFLAPAPAYDPSRLVTVPDSPALDPGTARATISVRLNTTGTGEYNVIQKGQAPDTGFYKIQVNGNGARPGIPDCTFGNGRGNQRVLIATTTTVNDGLWHSISCTKDTSATGTLVMTLTVDGAALTKNFTTTPAFALGNTKPLTIGGKSKCNGTTVDCDYFEGLIDSAGVATG